MSYAPAWRSIAGMSRTHWARLGAVLVAAGLLWPAAAVAIPGSSPHAVVDIWSSTTRPGASGALGYAARFHAAGDPSGDPPALRHLVIELPPGTRIDTSVLPRCTATDEEIELRGESACPPGARIGSGEATARILGFGTQTFETVIYNAEDDMLELIKSGDRVMSVVHTYVRGTTLDGPVPTCLNGGNPPDGCPFDQVTLLSNYLEVNAATVGGRNYGTTPPKCPKSKRWRTPVTFYFGDGSVERATTQQRCSRPKKKRRPSRR